MRNLLIVALIFLSGCATVQAQGTVGGPVLNFLVADLQQARDNFLEAAKRQPEGSTLQKQFTTDAACVSATLDRLASLHGDLDTKVKGLFSLGGALHIQLAEARARSSAGVVSAECNQLIGEMVTSLSATALRSTTGLVVRNLLP